MQPQVIIFNIAIIVGIVGIIVYWIRRFAVFLGYKSIQPDVLQIAELLKAQAARERSDVVVAGHFSGNPTIIRFSHRVDTPGLDIQMRLPATLAFSLVPKTISANGEGRVVSRTGSVSLDRRFTARTDHPVEFKMLTAGSNARAALEQLCCSSQTGVSIKNATLELSELTIPPFTANHVFDHLQSMVMLAKGISDMPGSDRVKVEPLPRQGSSWPVRIALAGGLVCLTGLLLTQPYNPSSGANASFSSPAASSGVLPVDAVRLQRLQGWRVMKADDFSESALRVVRENQLTPSGHVMGDFSGRSGNTDSAYLLVDDMGHKRVSMLASGMVAYDAIFTKVDLLVRVPKNSVAKIQWSSPAPRVTPDGDALLVIQNANDPTTSLVLLRHGTQTYSARPADFTKIDFAPQ
jgi:hypothetical protein